MVIKNKNIKKTKGLSPVIATILLIALVLVIALIVFLWVRGMTQDAITKFDNRNVQLVCDDVKFEASYESDGLYITNYGSVPVFGMRIKVIGDGSHTTIDLRENENWDNAGLTQGAVFSDENFKTDIESKYTGTVNKLVAIPVLLGNSNSGRKTYVCNEKQHGYEMYI